MSCIIFLCRDTGSDGALDARTLSTFTIPSGCQRESAINADLIDQSISLFQKSTAAPPWQFGRNRPLVPDFNDCGGRDTPPQQIGFLPTSHGQEVMHRFA